MFKGRVSKILIILFVLTAAVFCYVYFGWENSDSDASPVISFDETSLTISVEDDEEVLLEGVEAYDEEDGDLTGSVVIESISDFADDGSRIVTYAVFDSANNVTKASRSFYYSDYTSPEIILLEELVVSVGSRINLQDYIEVYDVLDGIITSQLQITESEYSMYYAGDYEVTFQVTNSAGDTQEVTYIIRCVENGDDSSGTSIVLTAYSVYIELGEDFNAEDYIESVSGYNYYGVEITKDYVKITGDVDTNEEGVYTVLYELSTYSGSDQVYLTVIVR